MGFKNLYFLQIHYYFILLFLFIIWIMKIIKKISFFHFKKEFNFLFIFMINYFFNFIFYDFNIKQNLCLMFNFNFIGFKTIHYFIIQIYLKRKCLNFIIFI